MGGLLHLVQRGGAWAVCGPVQSPTLLAVPNVTAHPSTASVPITYCYMMVRCCAVLMWRLKGYCSLQQADETVRFTLQCMY